MKIFDNTTFKSNLFVFIFFLVLTIIAVTFSGCGDEKKPIVIKDTKTMDSTDMFGPVLPGEKDEFDFSQDDGVSDSLVYGDWEPGEFLPDSVYFNNIQYIDSIKKLSN